MATVPCAAHRYTPRSFGAGIAKTMYAKPVEIGMGRMSKEWKSARGKKGALARWGKKKKKPSP